MAFKSVEKASLAVSILTLLAALCTPLATYYWLQNDIRTNNIKAESLIASTSHHFDDDGGDSFFVFIKNIGSLPLEKVRVFVRVPGYIVGEADKQRVEIIPPAQKVVEVARELITVSLQDPTPPGSDFHIVALRLPAQSSAKKSKTIPQFWVSSASSPPIELQSSGAFW
jgi:hypothetical protein